MVLPAVLVGALKFLGLNKVGQAISIFVMMLIAVGLLFVITAVAPTFSLVLFGVILLALAAFYIKDENLFKFKFGSVNGNARGIVVVGGASLIVFGLLGITVGGFINSVTGTVVSPLGSAVGQPMQLQVNEEPVLPFGTFVIALIASIIGGAFVQKTLSKKK